MFADVDRSSPDRPRVKRPQGQHIPRDVRPGTQAAFLAAFVELANETGACRAIQIDRSLVRWWEEHDETFSLRYQDTKEQVNDDIRAEIHRRSVTGYLETVVTPKGETFDVTRWSDRLLEFWAKARMLEFRDKQQLDITSNGQTVGQIDLTQLVALQATLMQAVDDWRRERGFVEGDALSG